MKKALQTLDQHFEEVILGVFLLLITAVIFLQIIFRYAVSSSLIWPEEFARYCLVCSTIFSLAYCMRKGIMMKIDIVANLFPKMVRKVLNLAIYLLSLYLYLYLFYYSIDVARTAADTSQKEHGHADSNEPDLLGLHIRIGTYGISHGAMYRFLHKEMEGR